jgi:TetR/AcrR family transcriptional repressor of mexJK operon
VIEPKRPPGRPRAAELRVPTAVAIVQAAATLFMDAGYRAVTMDMVASAAGVTKAAVYYHFKDKASLFVATAQFVLGQARRATEQLLAQDEPLREKLVKLAHIVLRLPQPFTSFDAMMHEAKADLSADQLAEVLQQQHEIEGVVERALVDASARGTIRADDPTLVTHAFLALLRVGQARSDDGEQRFPDVQRTAELLVRTIWDGIGCDRMT